MNPAILALIIQGLQAAITAAPGAVEVVKNAVALIASLFSAKAITAEQQDRVRAYVDAVAAQVLAGQEPPHWQVEPDPV